MEDEKLFVVTWTSVGQMVFGLVAEDEVDQFNAGTRTTLNFSNPLSGEIVERQARNSAGIAVVDDNNKSVIVKQLEFHPVFPMQVAQENIAQHICSCLVLGSVSGAVLKPVPGPVGSALGFFEDYKKFAKHWPDFISRGAEVIDNKIEVING